MTFSVILLLFSILNVYPQYLEPEDIDIFINKSRELGNYVAEKARTKMEYVKYMTDVYMLLSVFLITISQETLSDEELSRNKNIFNNFLNTEIEEDYEAAFREAGWENNGHQKYWTIYFGVYSIIIYNRIQDSYRDQGIEKHMIEQYYRIIEFIYKEDFEIINSRIEDIANNIR
jgi:hypothetical protein